MFLKLNQEVIFISYAIIRNEKYKRSNLKGICRHNERKNKNYSNKNIDKTRTHLNYHLKEPIYSYEKEFERIKKENDLKGQIKEVSNIVCEYIITSDKEFFNEIGEEETKRFFKTAYDFVCQYKDLGEQYVLSAVVHMDEDTPHLHLVYIPVVHTLNKQSQEIDKIACSEFWKAKDSYRQLQNSFYEYMVSNNFDLERGEQDKRKHYSIKEYKELTNYDKTKELLENINLDLPKTPNVQDIKLFTRNRDEKIVNEIIKPKDELIQELYKDNLSLHKELSKKSNLIEQVETFEKERVNLVNDNNLLKSKCRDLENNLNEKTQELKNDYEVEISRISHEYKRKINKLESENKSLNRIIENVKTVVHKFINWVSKKLSITSEKEIINKFENETYTSFDLDRQLNVIEAENDELEL